MKTLLIHLANVLSTLAPVRETLGIRRWLYAAGGVEIGRGTRVTSGVRIYDRYVSIGSDCWIGPGTLLHSNSQGPIHLGDGIDIAPGVIIVSGTHEPGAAERRAGTGIGKPISIGGGSWVGTGARILAGVTIGKGSVIAAGAVVTEGDYPANALLAGVPAKVKKIYE